MKYIEPVEIPLKGPVEKFLYQGYGYGKIDELLKEHEKNPKKLADLEEFFAGTVIGTYARSALVEKEPIDLEKPVERKKVKWPRISKVRTTEEAKEEFRDSWGIRRKDLPYHIINGSLFSGYNREKVENFLDEDARITDFFPDIKISKAGKIKEVWKYRAVTKDISIYVFGSAPNNSKHTLVDFNLPEEFKDYLNSLVKEYNHLIWALGGFEKREFG